MQVFSFALTVSSWKMFAGGYAAVTVVNSYREPSAFRNYTAIFPRVVGRRPVTRVSSPRYPPVPVGRRKQLNLKPVLLILMDHATELDRKLAC